MRMLEMLMELIAGILGLIKKGEYQKASQSIDNLYHDLLKRDASFFNNIPVSELTSQLIQKHNFTNGHLEILSELFLIQAELSSAQGHKAESLLFFRKSLLLSEFVTRETRTFSLDKESKVNYVKRRVAELEKFLLNQTD